MKKSLLLILLITFLMSCRKVDNPVESTVDTESVSQLNIRVDPRMELLAVIQHFTSWAPKRHTKLNFAYIQDIDSYFRNFSKHPAVQMSEQLSNSGFSYDAPPAFVLYHNNPPEFKQIIVYSDYLKKRASGESVLIDFAVKIRTFAVESNFMTFFNSHKDFYGQIQDDLKNTLGDTQFVMALENFYGDRKNSYNIIPTPLFHAGGYGPQIQSEKGEDIFDVCGPMSISGDRLNFGDKNYLYYILLHEFSHSFVNPITGKYSYEIDKSKSLFEPIRIIMTQQAYTDWPTCVNEHLVRINVARIPILGGQNHIEMKKQIIQYELSNGFRFITNLDTLMQRYDDNRDKYKTYESFYPEIINLFNTLAK